MNQGNVTVSAFRHQLILGSCSIICFLELPLWSIMSSCTFIVVFNINIIIHKYSYSPSPSLLKSSKSSGSSSLCSGPYAIPQGLVGTWVGLWLVTRWAHLLGPLVHCVYLLTDSDISFWISTFNNKHIYVSPTIQPSQHYLYCYHPYHQDHHSHAVGLMLLGVPLFRSWLTSWSTVSIY